MKAANSMTWIAGLVTLVLTIGCKPRYPREDTAETTIETIVYVVKLNGTVAGPGFPIPMTVTARSGTATAPPVTGLRIVYTPKDGGSPTVHADIPAVWAAGDGGWIVEIPNPFPSPENRRLTALSAGSFWVTVVFNQGERELGRSVPLEVMLGVRRPHE